MAILFWQDPDSLNFHAVEFDATVTEELTFSSNITRSPRERGVSSTDHVEPLPDGVRLEGMVTNTPVVDGGQGYTDGDLLGPIVSAYLWQDFYTTNKRLVSGARVSAPGRPGLHVPGVPPRVLAGGRPTVTPAVWVDDVQTFRTRSLHAVTPVNRVLKVLEFLRGLVSRGVEVTVDTRYQTFDTMLIRSVSCPTTAQDSMTFSIELEASNIANVATTTVTAFVNSVDEPRKKPPVKGGRKPQNPIPTGVESYDQMQSIIVDTYTTDPAGG